MAPRAKLDEQSTQEPAEPAGRRLFNIRFASDSWSDDVVVDWPMPPSEGDTVMVWHEGSRKHVTCTVASRFWTSSDGYNLVVNVLVRE